MGRLVKINPATEEKNGQAAVTATGARGRLVKTGDVQRTSPAGNTIRAQPQTSRKTPYQKALDEVAAKTKKGQEESTSFGARALKGVGSGIVAEGANLANLGGVVTDRRGGTGMSDIYREQVELLDGQIAALEKTLKNPKMSAQNISDTKEALALARSEREKYSRAAESGEKTAKSLYETADKGYSLAQKLGNESTAGTKGVKKGVLKVIPAATQIGLQTAERMVAPGFDMIGRAASVAGGSAADYRHKAGEQYDAEKAALRATVSALGVAAGGALSKGVNAAGLKLLRAAGKQNYVLPNIALGGASAVGYAAGETGASELSKAMTDEDYTPDWKAIGETALTAFAFGAISSAINAAAITGRNKRYMNELNDAVKERYNYAKRIIEDPRATAGQKAAGAESVMNAADKMRGALDELQVVGAQKEVDAMREFLLSIYGEMMPYTNTNAGGIGTGTAGIVPVTPGGGIMTVRPGEGTNPMQEAAPTAPITPRAAGAAAAQNIMPAQSAAAQEGAQGTGEGNLTTMPQSAVQGAQEVKADALETGGRVPLDQYATPENAQRVSQEINDGTLAVDSHNKIYRVDAGEHIDRRDSASVGKRSVNAFQFDHPELHQYFAEAAADLSEEMSFAQRGGELIRRTSREAGDDEYIRTKRGVSERIARLLDDEGVRYDDIDRSLDAIIHNHGQENFAAAKRVELLLDDMLTNGYTDIHGKHIAPNEEYIAAKKAIPGADMSERTHEELPIYDMPEGQNGGIYGRQEENAGGPEPAESTGQRADAVAAENDLHGGDRGRRPSEPGAGGAGELRSTTAEGRRRNRELTQRRREIAWEQPLTSAAALGVQGGTSDETLHVLPEEDWDDELRGFSDWARGKGVKRVTMVTGLLQVETENGPVGVRGIINRESGEMVLRVDGEKRTASEIGKHEVGHLITEEENVRAFMETVRGGADWRGIYEAYERCYEPLTNGYVGMTAEERELYVWEEIMEDAYAGLDSYGQRASRYHEQAVELLDRAPEAPAQAVSEPENVHLRAVDEPKGRGPPEKYSIGEITGDDLTEYGIGVHLDSALLENLTPKERIEMVKERVKELGGETFTAYDSMGNAVDISIANPRDRFRNRNGKNKPVNKDLATKYIGNETKQEAVVLVDELITTAKYLSSETPRYSHDWLDNNGKNNWDYWTTYVQDKSGTIWEATLNIANAANGKKFLYDISPIKKVGQSVKSDTSLLSTGQPVKSGTSSVDASVAEDAPPVKYSAFNEEVARQLAGEDRGKVKFSAEDEGDEWNRELERMPESVQEAVRRVKGSRGSSMREFPNLDAYLSDKGARLAEEKAERLRNRGKDEFGGTKALEKLGVKIENSAGDYSVVDQLIANDQAAKTIQRETRKAIKRLGATPKEQNFARNIASGLYDEEDIPTTMNRGKVMQLADYYSAKKSMSTDLIKERRREIKDRLQEKMEDLFDEHFVGEFTAPKRGKGIAPESGLALYHRTPQRSMRAIFGWDRGQQINEAIFEPVYVNEQERKRFVNRMHDEVRTFKGEDGKEDALTQRERALAQLMIEGKAVEEMVGKSEIKQQIIHAAENLLDGAEMKDTAQEFGLHGKEERELAQRYADWLETKRELDSGSVDKARVENAAKKYSGLYDEFYAAINDFLVAHGYEPIGFIKGYAPHFQPEAESGKLESALKAIGVDLGAEVGKLPASIAGLTKEFKPNKRYNPFFQHRKGTSTDYDIQKGFEKYIDYLSDVLYHTDDAMRVRAAAKYFRRKYAPDDISALIEQAEDLKFATPEEKELFLKTNGIVDDDVKLSYQAMNRAMEQYTEDLFNDVTQTTKYGDLVTWLDDYGNKLAGKQLFNDRSMEREVGRTSLNVGRKLVSTFARANVAGNLSSSLNQTAQLPLIAGELGPKYIAEAIGDIARGKAKGDFADRSDFLTEKRGIRYLTNTKGDKITTALFWPLERMDYLMSTIAVRGRYRKELAEGKSEKEALRAADRWGRDVMGSRSKGTAPLTFQSKNLISQMVNLFQVEALNSWEHVSQDIFGPGLREMEAKLGKKEASRRLAGIIVGTLLGAFLLNRLDEELYGGTPAQFDVLGLLTGFLASGNGLTTNEQLGVWFDDVWQKMTGERLFGTDEDAGNDKFNLAAAAEDTMYNISNDVPYVRNVSGLLGVGDQTLPMPDLYGTAKGIGGAFEDAAEGDMRSFSEEIARQLMGLAGDTLPGGRQAEKTAQGIEAVVRGGSYKGSGDNKRLQYPVESPLVDPWTALRAAIFGKNAIPESRTYWAAGGKALSAAQTKLYGDLVDSGLSRKRAYEILKRFNDATADLEADRDKNGNPIGGSKKEKIVREINKLPLSRKQKNLLYLSKGYSEKDLNGLPWN